MNQNTQNQHNVDAVQSINQKRFRTSLSQGWSSKNTSRITQETKRATQTYQIIMDDIEDEEAQPLPFQTEEAKKKVTKLHGINFGRSLTLDDQSYVLVENKPKIIRILIIIGLISIAGLFLSTSYNVTVDKMQKKKKKSSKKKNK